MPRSANAARGTLPRARRRESPTRGSPQRPRSHLGGDQRAPRTPTRASFPELVKQLGVMRFGHRPRVADLFCGSGQNPLRGGTARLRRLRLRPEPRRVHAHVGCPPHRGRFVGGAREAQAGAESHWSRKCRPRLIDRLGIEADGTRLASQDLPLLRRSPAARKAGGACRCYLAASISKTHRVIAELVPDPAHKRYDIVHPHPG